MIAPIILVHGAGNSAAVWAFWQRELAADGWPSYAVDLRVHGKRGPADLSHVSMEDYAADVREAVGGLRQRPVLLGWSMGGLIAMIVARSGAVSACVTLAPSIPSLQVDPSVELRSGEYGPEEYGITSLRPDDQPSMPDLNREERELALASLGRESRLARDERRRGVVIEALPCPLLLVTGTADTQWPSETYDRLWLPADRLSVEGASHWGLALNRRALAQAVPAVCEWVRRVVGE